jgi:RNA polymerase sigma-70 factor (ECF subfamily)
MATRASRPLARHLEELWETGTVAGFGDSELLRRLLSSNGPARDRAFEAIVERHGPMVLAVCRQLLRNPQDVEDAFQATFLVLIRKAKSIRVGRSLAPWLYGVAHRTSLRTRALSCRLRQEDGHEPEAATPWTSDESRLWEIRLVLHEELDRLPEKYRAPIVLCHLEGKSHEEAARALCWPVGTLSGRLSRARSLLRARLERRGWKSAEDLVGVSLPVGAGPGIPVPLLRSLVQTAFSSPLKVARTTAVDAITQGVLKTMFWNKSKSVAVILVMGLAFSGSAGLLIRSCLATGPETVGVQEGPASTKPSGSEASTRVAVRELAAPELQSRQESADQPATKKKAAGAPDDITLETASPVVVRTVPESGTTDVDASLSEIRVTFSKEMLDGSWSWTTASANTFPKVTGDIRYLDDHKTCVLPVKLESGRTYATWINSGRFINFKDRGRRPAVPYLLIFQTKP